MVHVFSKVFSIFWCIVRGSGAFGSVLMGSEWF